MRPLPRRGSKTSSIKMDDLQTRSLVLYQIFLCWRIVKRQSLPEDSMLLRSRFDKQIWWPTLEAGLSIKHGTNHCWATMVRKNLEDSRPFLRRTNCSTLYNFRFKFLMSNPQPRKAIHSSAFSSGHSFLFWRVCWVWKLFYRSIRNKLLFRSSRHSYNGTTSVSIFHPNFNLAGWVRITTVVLGNFPWTQGCLLLWGLAFVSFRVHRIWNGSDGLRSCVALASTKNLDAGFPSNALTHYVAISIPTPPLLLPLLSSSILLQSFVLALY